MLKQDAESGLFDKAMKAMQDTFDPQLESRFNILDTHPQSANKEEINRMVSFFSSKEETGTHVQSWERNLQIYLLETDSCLSYKVVDTQFTIHFGLTINKSTQKYSIIIDHLHRSSDSIESFLLKWTKQKMAQKKKEKPFQLHFIENLQSMLLHILEEKEWLNEEECFLFETTFPNDLKTLKELLMNGSSENDTAHYIVLQRTEDAIQQAIEKVKQCITERKNKVLEKQIRVIEARSQQTLFNNC